DGRQAVGLRLVVEIEPGGSGLSAGGAAHRVDADVPHAGEVDHQAAVDQGGAGGIVAPATHGDGDIVAAGEAHGVDHVRSPGAAHDELRALIDHAVPDFARLLVVIIAGADQVAAQAELEVLDRGLAEGGAGYEFFYHGVTSSSLVLSFEF